MSLEKRVSGRVPWGFVKVAAAAWLAVAVMSSLASSQEVRYPKWGTPKKATFEEIVGENNRETEMFQYQRNANIYVIDFGGPNSLAHQAQVMNRLAAFVEKAKAPKERVLDDRELEKFIKNSRQKPETFYLAHDYRAEDMARFFSAAEAQKVRLNREELKLRAVLVRHEFMKKGKEGLYETVRPLKALVSIPEDQRRPKGCRVTPKERREIFGHELGHAEYFTNEAYRKYCAAFWNGSLTADERKAIRSKLAKEGYDTENEDLMINEMQAYLGHTPADWLRVGISKDRRRELVEQFLSGCPVESALKDRGRDQKKGKKRAKPPFGKLPPSPRLRRTSQDKQQTSNGQPSERSRWALPGAQPATFG